MPIESFIEEAKSQRHFSVDTVRNAFCILSI